LPWQPPIEEYSCGTGETAGPYRDNGLLSNSVNGLVLLAGKLYAATDKGLSIIDIHTSGKHQHRLDIDVDNRFNQ